METITKFAFVEREGDHSDLQVDFDDELFADLCEKEGWLELTKRLKDNRRQHILVPPEKSWIRCIKWEE